MPVFPGDIGDAIQKSREQKWPETRTWDLVRAYLEDRQWLAWDNTARAYVNDVDVSRGTSSRVVVNILKPLYRTLVSLLATQYPGVRVLPASPSIEDVTQATASTLAVEYYWQQDRLQAFFNKVVKWLCATGNVGRHTYYHGDERRVRTDAVSPYDLFCTPGVIEPEEADFWAVRTLVARKDLVASYKSAGADKVKAVENAAAYDQRDSTNAAQEQRVPEDRLEVFEVYWSDRRHAVWLGKSGPYLFTGETPKGLKPVELVRYTDIPGRLWGQGPFISAVDLQNQYNQGRGLAFDVARLMANPMWLVPTPCQVQEGSISNKPGKKILYNPVGGAPQRIPGVGLPSDFYANLDRTQSEILDIVGVHNVTLGKAPVTLRSGKAIEATSALDVGQLQMTQQNIEAMAQQLATDALILMKAHYTEGQWVRMLDQSGRVVSQQIEHTDYVDDPEVTFEANSLFRQESEDKDAQTLQLYEMKLIDADEARQRLSSKLGDFKQLQKMRSWAHAQKILSAAAGRLGANVGVDILPTDDLESIKQVFDEFVQTDEFGALPPDRQEYVTSILRAVAGAQGGQAQGLDPNELARANFGKVWPPQPRNDRQAEELQVAAASPLTQAQVDVERRAAMERDQQGAPRGVPGGPPDGGMG